MNNQLPPGDDPPITIEQDMHRSVPNRRIYNVSFYGDQFTTTVVSNDRFTNAEINYFRSILTGRQRLLFGFAATWVLTRRGRFSMYDLATINLCRGNECLILQVGLISDIGFRRLSQFLNDNRISLVGMRSRFFLENFLWDGSRHRRLTAVGRVYNLYLQMLAELNSENRVPPHHHTPRPTATIQHYLQFNVPWPPLDEEGLCWTRYGNLGNEQLLLGSIEAYTSYRIVRLSLNMD